MRRELIEKCAKGHPQAIYQFVDEYRRQIAPLAFAVVGHSAAETKAFATTATATTGAATGAAATDAVNDAMASAVIAAVRAMADAPGGVRFPEWLRDRAVSALQGQTRESDAPLKRVPANAPPTSPITRHADVATLHSLIGRLDPPERQVLWATMRERLTIGQAARLFEFSADEAKKHFDAALKKLRHYIIHPPKGMDAGDAAESGDSKEKTAVIAADVESDLRRAIYGDLPPVERTRLQSRLVTDSAGQARYDALTDERLHVGKAFDVPTDTTQILRTVRSRYKYRRALIPPWAWIAAEVMIAVAIVVGLIVVGNHVPTPRVQVTLDAGHARLFAATPAADNTTGNPLMIAVNPPGSDSAVGASAGGGSSSASVTLESDMAIGDELATGPMSHATLYINGDNALHLGADTRIAMRAPTAQSPARFELRHGTVYFNFRGAADRLRIDTGLADLLAYRAEAIVEAKDTVLTVIVLDGEIGFSAATNSAYALHPMGRLIAGQAARLNTTLDPQPVEELRPPGFARARLSASDASLAMSPEYVRRRLLDADGRLKSRFHWLDAHYYPLAFDRVPPAVQTALDNFYAQSTQLRLTRDVLQTRIQALLNRVRDLQVMRDNQSIQIRHFSLELAQIAQQQQELAARRAELQTMQTELDRRMQNPPGGRPVYDPSHARRFSVRAQIEALQAELAALRQLEIRRLALQTTVAQLQPRLADATREAAEAQTALNRLVGRSEQISAEFSALQNLDAELAALRTNLQTANATIAATAQRLASTDAELTAAEAESRALDTRLTAARRAHAELQSARDRLAQATTTAEAAELHRQRTSAELAAARTTVAERQRQLESAQTTHAAKQAELQRIEQTAAQNLAAVRAAETAVETAQRELTAATQAKATAEANVARLTSTITALAAEIEQLSAARLAAAERLKRVTDQIDALKAERETATATHAAAEQAARQAASASEAAQTALTAARRAESAARGDLRRAESALSAAQRTATESAQTATAAASALAEAETAFEAAQRAVADAQRAEQIARADINNVRTQMRRADENAAAAERAETAARTQAEAAQSALQTAAQAVMQARTAQTAATADAERTAAEAQQAATTVATASAARETAETALAEAEAHLADLSAIKGEAEALLPRLEQAFASLGVWIGLNRDLAAAAQAEWRTLRDRRAQLQAEADLPRTSRTRRAEIAAELETITPKLSAAQARASTANRLAGYFGAMLDHAEKRKEIAQAERNAATTALPAAQTAVRSARSTVPHRRRAEQRAQEIFEAAERAATEARATVAQCQTTLDRAIAVHRDAQTAHQAAQTALGDAQRQTAAAREAVETARRASVRIHETHANAQRASSEAQANLQTATTARADRQAAHSAAQTVAQTAQTTLAQAQQTRTAAAAALTTATADIASATQTAQQRQAEQTAAQQQAHASTVSLAEIHAQIAADETRVAAIFAEIEAISAPLESKQQEKLAAERELTAIEETLPGLTRTVATRQTALQAAQRTLNAARVTAGNDLQHRDAAIQAAQTAAADVTAQESAQQRALADANRAEQRATTAAQENATAAAAKHRAEAAVAAAAAQAVDEIAPLETQLQAVQATVNRLRESQQTLRQAVASQRQQIRTLEADIAARQAGIERRETLRRQAEELAPQTDAARAVVTVWQQAVQELTVRLEPSLQELAEIEKSLARMEPARAELAEVVAHQRQLLDYAHDLDHRRREMALIVADIDRLEAAAGVAVEQSQRHRLSREYASRWDTVRVLEAESRALWFWQGLLETFDETTYETQIATLKDRLFDVLRGHASSYATVPLYRDELDAMLREAIALYPLYRDRSGPTMAGDPSGELDRQWRRYVREFFADPTRLNRILRLEPAHLTALASATFHSRPLPSNGDGDGDGNE